MNRADNNNVEATIKEFILTEFLPGEDPEALTASTPLMSTGILDSIASLKLVAFLEERFHITIAAHEVNVDHLNSVATIAELVHAKQGGSPA